jgi:putative tryptophan/tyrosine transport system substrate-binding protein
MSVTIGRRELIAALGGAAAWPLAAQAQQDERMRRVGVLAPYAADDEEGQRRIAAFLKELQQFGWAEGRNIQIVYRWGAADAERIRTSKAELLGVADVILSQGSSITSALQQATNTVPVVFVNVADPVGAGFVDSLSRPGGNITGFMNFEYGFSGKWLEVLKEIAPRMSRVGVLRDPTIASGSGQLGAIQSVAPGLGVELYPINVKGPTEIERGITGFVRSTDDGLIVTASPLAAVHRKLIVMLARRHRMPAIYWDRTSVHDGGLISYGADLTDQFRRAASYVDRILKGENPADLPVQAPTKYELVINLKTAKVLGLTIPPGVLAIADEVIE